MAAVKLTASDREAITAARRALEEIRDRIQGEYEARSDKWQASAAGDEALALIDAVQDVAEELAGLEG